MVVCYNLEKNHKKGKDRELAFLILILLFPIILRFEKEKDSAESDFPAISKHSCRSSERTSWYQAKTRWQERLHYRHQRMLRRRIKFVVPKCPSASPKGSWFWTRRPPRQRIPNPNCRDSPDSWQVWPYRSRSSPRGTVIGQEKSLQMLISASRLKSEKKSPQGKLWILWSLHIVIFWRIYFINFPVSTLPKKDILSFTVFYRFSSINSSLRFPIVTAMNPSTGESKKDRKKNPTPDRPL